MKGLSCFSILIVLCLTSAGLYVQQKPEMAQSMIVSDALCYKWDSLKVVVRVSSGCMKEYTIYSNGNLKYQFGQHADYRSLKHEFRIIEEEGMVIMDQFSINIIDSIASICHDNESLNPIGINSYGGFHSQIFIDSTCCENRFGGTSEIIGRALYVIKTVAPFEFSLDCY